MTPAFEQRLLLILRLTTAHNLCCRSLCCSHFDVDHNRIGFAESPCDYSHLLQEYGYEAEFDLDSEADSNKEPNEDGSEPYEDDDPVTAADDDEIDVEISYDEVGDDSISEEMPDPGDAPPYIPEDDDRHSTQLEAAMGETTNSSETSSSKKKKGKGPLLFFGLILMGGVGVYVVTGGNPSTLYGRLTGGGGGGYHQVTQQQSLSGEDGALEVELSLASFYRRLGGGNGSTELS